MKIETDAILENGYFDSRYTCDIDNSSPELRWSEAPQGTQGFAIIAQDLDHPQARCHWTIYNIPASVSHVPAGIPPQEVLPNGIRQGLNGWGKLGYAGPCPPENESHSYCFQLFALGSLPEITGRVTYTELLKIIEPYILETARITGRYQRLMQAAG